MTAASLEITYPAELPVSQRRDEIARVWDEFFGEG